MTGFMYVGGERCAGACQGAKNQLIYVLGHHFKSRSLKLLVGPDYVYQLLTFFSFARNGTQHLHVHSQQSIC
jgi:hypothetical protein